MGCCSREARVHSNAVHVSTPFLKQLLHGSLLRTVLLALCLVAPLDASAQVRYHYDALGRLIQAVSPDGTSVHYSYDAVGNMTAIRRLAANTLSVIEFTPRTGTPGSTVTVYGSGFDPSAAANAVTFNGTAAAVASATETTLIVTVPDGATSGKIAVSNANGSATSDANYVVSGTSLAPTIVSFTPHVGTQGTVVTLAGTNFQTNAEDDKIMIGRQFAVVVSDAASPTSTQLKLSVPSTSASGTLAITTPFGKAVDTSEFFAVPGTVNPADVEFTGRLSVNGSALSVNTTANGKKAVLLFDAQAGQKLRLVTQSSSFASAVIADIYGPDGTKIETLPLSRDSTKDFTNPLASDGTYSVILSTATSEKESIQVSLVVDIVGSLALDGSTAVSLIAGQNGRFSFTAEASKGYGLAVTGLSFTSSAETMMVTLRKADGTRLVDCLFTSDVASGSCDLDPTNFPSTDTYLLDFDPAKLNATSFNAVLSKDAGGVITGGALRCTSRAQDRTRGTASAARPGRRPAWSSKARWTTATPTR